MKKKTTKKTAKKVVRKPVKEVLITDTEFFKPAINWEKVPTGTYFNGTVEGFKTEGFIFNAIDEEDRIYFLTNNKNLDGDESDSGKKLGFTYSWSVYRDDLDNCVEVIVTKTPPKSFIPPVKPVRLNDEYEVTFKKGEIQVGCTTISNEKVREIVKLLKD